MSASAGRSAVYNLSVEGEEEYFANGILVHNCRYLCLTYRDQKLPEPFNALVQRRIGEERARNPNLTTEDLIWLNRKLERDERAKRTSAPINPMRNSRRTRMLVRGLIGPGPV